MIVGTVSYAAIAATGNVAFSGKAKSMGKGVYVGIDPSITNTGLCVLSKTGDLILCADCGNGKKKKNEPDIIRYLRQAESLTSFLRPFKIEAMTWENYSFGSVHKSYALAECNGVMKAEVFRLAGSLPFYAAPTQLKKFAVGNGQAGKAAVSQQAHRECPRLPDAASTDICDAFFLAKIAFYRDRPEVAMISDRGNPFLRLRLEMIMRGKRYDRDSCDSRY